MIISSFATSKRRYVWTITNPNHVCYWLFTGHRHLDVNMSRVCIRCLIGVCYSKCFITEGNQTNGHNEENNNQIQMQRQWCKYMNDVWRSMIQSAIATLLNWVFHKKAILPDPAKILKINTFLEKSVSLDDITCKIQTVIMGSNTLSVFYVNAVQHFIVSGIS